MKILSPTTQPWRGKISRRHSPRPASFNLYRPCLRWEFGFSCAFCLCHEADFGISIEGSGATHIEHFVPQDVAPHRRDDYSNCFYVCGYCNRARLNAPNRSPAGHTLLDPCEGSWGEIFKLADDKILPQIEADGNALYTIDTYDLNEPRKLARRKLRSKIIGQRVKVLEECREQMEKWVVVASEKREDAFTALAREMVEGLRSRRDMALDDLVRWFPAIPRDCDRSCRCGNDRNHSLPTVLDEQTIDLREEVLRSSSRED